MVLAILLLAGIAAAMYFWDPFHLFSQEDDDDTLAAHVSISYELKSAKRLIDECLQNKYSSRNSL